jgi:hypothetical protein
MSGSGIGTPAVASPVTPSTGPAGYITTDYCSLDEACALLPGAPTLRDAATGITATRPSQTQGGAILTSVSAEIDMHLRSRDYSLPVTDDDALASLKTICMSGTAARIGKALTSKDEQLVTDLREDYKAGLEFIDKGGLGDDVTVQDTNSFAHGFPRRCWRRSGAAPF